MTSADMLRRLGQSHPVDWTAMVTHEDPGFYRRRVRDALRKAREARHLTQREAAQALDWSMSKLVRIEAGTVGVSTTDLRALLALYGVEDKDEVERLAGMARATRRRPWFSKYQRILTPVFAQYLGYESSATVIRAFQPLTIPGLLQTDDYARAVLAANHTNEIEERVELRVARQELLDRVDGPEIAYVLDEAALRRIVGGPMVMRGQLRRLQEAIEHPSVSVQAIPFAEGAHAAMSGAFTVLSFADQAEDALYLETGMGSLLSREDQGLVAEYLEAFDHLRNKALEVKETSELITSLIDQLQPAD